MGGVTGTGVIATHRRRGLLRSMMQAMFDDALARGEAVSELSASEGSIYARFGSLRQRCARVGGWTARMSPAMVCDA